MDLGHHKFHKVFQPLSEIRAAAVPVGEESCSCPRDFDVIERYKLS